MVPFKLQFTAPTSCDRSNYRFKDFWASEKLSVQAIHPIQLPRTSPEITMEGTPRVWLLETGPFLPHEVSGPISGSPCPSNFAPHTTRCLESTSHQENASSPDRAGLLWKLCPSPHPGPRGLSRALSTLPLVPGSVITVAQVPLLLRSEVPEGCPELVEEPEARQLPWGGFSGGATGEQCSEYITHLTILWGPLSYFETAKQTGDQR